MAAVFEQATGNFGFTAGASIAQAYGSAVKAGSLLYAAFGTDNNTALSVSDSVNGAWTAVGAGNTVNGTLVTRAFYKLNSAAGTPTVTATHAGAGPTYKNLRIGEWSSVDTAAAPDTSNASTGSSVAPATSITTTVDHDLVVGSTYVTNTGAAGGGFNSRAVIDGNVLEDLLDKTPAGVISVAFTQAPSGAWCATGAAFLLATASAAPVMIPSFQAIPFMR